MKTPPPKPSPLPTPTPDLLEPEYPTGEYPALNLSREELAVIEDRAKKAKKEAKAESQVALEAMQHFLTARAVVGGAVAVAALAATIIGTYVAFVSRAEMAGGAKAVEIEKTLNGHLASDALDKAAQRQDIYELKLDTRALYRSNLHGRREQRLEKDPPPPATDGGKP